MTLEAGRGIAAFGAEAGVERATSAAPDDSYTVASHRRSCQWRMALTSKQHAPEIAIILCAAADGAGLGESLAEWR